MENHNQKMDDLGVPLHFKQPLYGNNNIAVLWLIPLYDYS